MVCKNCGTLLPEDSLICPACGTAAEPDALYARTQQAQPLSAQPAEGGATVPPGPPAPKKRGGVIVAVILGVLAAAVVITVVSVWLFQANKKSGSSEIVSAENGNKASSEDAASADDAALEAEYQKDPNAYNQVDIRLFGLENADGAEEKLREMEGRITDEASFAALALEYAPEDEKATFRENTATLLYGVGYRAVWMNIEEATADWLFDPARKTGDTHITVTDSTVYCIYILHPAYRNEQPLVDVRHILIGFDAIAAGEAGDTAYSKTETAVASDGTTVSNEGTVFSVDVVLAAYEKARGIYDGFLEGEQSEAAFGKLADLYSDDTASTTMNGGGLYESVQYGQMVTPFNDWIYDDAREPGDTDLIMTSYGWHIMYFVQRHAQPAWKEAVRRNMDAQ